MSETLHFVVQHGYALLFLWLAAEQAALPVPSIPLLLACGALMRDGRMHPALVLAYGLAACLLADSVWFHVGKRGGGKVLRLLCRIALEPDSCVRRTENALIRYGPRSLLVAKFVPGLNAVAAPMAGSSGVGFLQFLLFDSLGVLIWITAYAGAGYLFAGQLEIIVGYALRTGSGLLLMVVGVVGASIGWKFLQRQRFLRKFAVARISADELLGQVRGGAEVLLVDLRNRHAAERDTVPGALRIPAEELEARHSEIPRDREIVLFCS
jgi:membrane protein DedA with SNARE-associated domain